MLYEDIQMSGSLDVTGSFIVPLGTSSVTASYEKGRMMIEKDTGLLYVWTGSWEVIGVQEETQYPPNSVFNNVVDLTASLASGTNLVTMSLSEAEGDNIVSTPFSASISGSSFEIIWSNTDSSSGFIRNTTELSAGTYYYNVTVFDSGSINSQSYNNQTVTVAALPVASANIEYLVVAGGGGGGAIAGAGGAGGLLSSSISSIESGSSITVTVGAGGAAKQLTSVANNSVDAVGTKGTNSSIASAAGTSFTTVEALGGGAGGYYAPNYGSSTAKLDGGSGGSMINFGGGGEFAGTGTTGQGNDGHIGTGASPYNTGGGGGAGADATSAGGGDGKQSGITGTLTYYAGGGGNSGFYNSAGQSGGQGGGADGAQASTNAVNATANTGGGGGGGGTTGGSQTSGLRYPSNGGSGVVIIAYDSGSISANGGIAKARADGQVYHTFNSSGNLTFGAINSYPILNGENFMPVIYTGTGGTQKIEVGFQPDLIWLKNREGTTWHNIHNSVVGITKHLYTNASNTEDNTGDGMSGTDSTGFTLLGGNGFNNNDTNFVAWCWKAGGSSTSDSSGDVTVDISANPSAGFSIVNYNDGGTNNQTAAHGLDQAPELVITKERSLSNDWIVYFTVVDGSHDFMRLNTTAAASDSGLTAPTADYIYTRGSTSDIINYCFHSVDGYQKIGTYNGTGSSLEIKVGFAPRWVMIKRYAATGDRWLIADIERGGTSNNDNFLDAQDSHVESALGATNGISLGTDSFTVNTTDGAANNSAGSYFYWAIA